MKQGNIAVRLACKYHQGQFYGKENYIIHLDSVAVRVDLAGGDDEQLAIAWLHDILEDTDCTVETMQQNGLSARVISAVIALTKVQGESYEEYISKVRDNPDALFVKKMDTLDNLTNSLIESNSYRIKKYAKQLLLLEE